jgi:NAD(P)-dependent dehydrogenase (short-subunit alcohol dehydrogenase family)
VSKSAVRSIKRSLPRRQLSPGNRVKEEPSAGAWLLSDEASFITGAIFGIDGGRLAAGA